MGQVISLSEWRKKQANTSNSKSQSMPNTASEGTGVKLTEEEMTELNNVFLVVHKAWQDPFTTKSDFARMAANEVALASCEGLITTQLNDHQFGNKWVVTTDGLEWMEAVVEDVLSTRH